MKKLLVLFVLLSPVLVQAQTYGGNVFVNGSVSCSDTYYNPPEYLCAYNTDLNTATNWHSVDGTINHWVKYDFGSGVAKKVAKLRLDIRNDGAGLQLKSFVLEASADDTNWTTVYTGITVNTGTGWQDFTFTNDTAYRWYRVRSTSTTWNTMYPQYVSFFEIQAMECTDCTVIPPPDGQEGELYGTSLFTDTSLMAYYRFEGNGNDSKNNYHLTDHTAGGTLTYPSGVFGTASDSGTNWAVNKGRYNEALCIASATTPVTLYAQVKINSLPPNSQAAYDGDFVNVPTCARTVEYTLGAGYFNTGTGQYGNQLVIFGNRARSGVGDSRLMYPLNMVPGQYYGIIFTWDGAGTEKLYLQATTGGPYTLVATLESQTTATGNNTYEKGASVNACWRVNNTMQAGVGGAIDDFAVFNRALTQTDANLLGGEEPPPEEPPSLNGLYTFFYMATTLPPDSDCDSAGDVGKTILTNVGGVKAFYACYSSGWKKLIF